MAARSLEELKGLISREYLGTRGIHGVGIHRATNALKLYVEADVDRELLAELAELARPFGLDVIRQDRAVAGLDPD